MTNISAHFITAVNVSYGDTKGQEYGCVALTDEHGNMTNIFFKDRTSIIELSTAIAEAWMTAIKGEEKFARVSLV